MIEIETQTTIQRPWPDILADLIAIPKPSNRKAERFIDRAITGAKLMAAGKPWKGARSLACDVDNAVMYLKGMTPYLGDDDKTARYAIRAAACFMSGIAK